MFMMSLLIMVTNFSMENSQVTTPPPLDKVYVVIFQENNSTHKLVPAQTEVEYSDMFQFINRIQQEDGEEVFNVTRTRTFFFDPLDSLLDVPIRVIPGKNIGHYKKQNITSPHWRSHRGAYLSNTIGLKNTTIREQLHREGDITLLVNGTTLNNMGLHAPVKDETHFSLWLIAGVIMMVVITAILAYITIRSIRGGCLKNGSLQTFDPNSMQLIELRTTEPILPTHSFTFSNLPYT